MYLLQLVGKTSTILTKLKLTKEKRLNMEWYTVKIPATLYFEIEAKSEDDALEQAFDRRLDLASDYETEFEHAEVTRM